jgi:predicted RNA binding protein YcfA (HicA-like mRNA interferase family)
MARSDNRLERMKRNPRDWRIEDLETAARAFGFNIRRSGGSHVIFEHPLLATALAVPARRPIKPIYVRRFLALIEALHGEDHNPS